MTARAPLPALVILASVYLAGCGCHDTGIEGDTDIDPGPWDPPIESLGEPGWRDSTEPWCSEAPTILGAFDVWSDSSAVYVFGDFFFNDGGSSTVGCPSEHCYGGMAIYRNDGDGWSLFWDRDLVDDVGSEGWFSGVPGEHLLVVTPRSEYCEFRHVFGIYEECALPGGDAVQDIVVVNASLAYAIMRDRVIYWDGWEWAPYPAAYTPYDVSNIWADEESIFCSGPDGTILSLEGEDWRVHDTGTLRTIGSLWGFSGDDVWAAGGGTGLMHYDGSTWEEMVWPDLDEDVHPCASFGIEDIWGADGIVYFHTQNELVMWDGVEFSVLGYWPMRTVVEGDSYHCEPGIEISAIWGNSPEEVFLAVRDPDHVTPDCGAEYVLWWDGSEFHWF